jgi:anti-sigma factor RsiW
MSFSDETLMAYADGELEPALAAEVEQAMRTDPAVEAAVRRHRLLRADVFAAFAGVLDEPVPERLQPAAAPSAPVHAHLPDTGGATVHSLEARRAAREAAVRPARAWPRWGALAASLAVGVLAGALGWQALGGRQEAFARQDGALVARGELAEALSRRLAAEPAGGDAMRLGVSFQARDGVYCRSFTLGATGGLACRENGQWRIPVLAEGEKEGGAYRQAGSAMPAAVLDAIDQRIAGPALDAPAERAARDRGWQGRK